MAGLKISQLTQPTLSADKAIRVGDLFPIARTVSGTLSTFAVPGASIINTLGPIGNGTSLIGTKTFSVSTGNLFTFKSLSAAAPLALVDTGSGTLVFSLSGTVTAAIAGLSPIKQTYTGGSGQQYFNLPSGVQLPTDTVAYRVDINGVVQEPNVDYYVYTDRSPFQIYFTDVPADGEKIVVVAYAPATFGVSNSAYSTPLVNPYSFLANTTTNIAVGTSFPLTGTNEFIGNIGNGPQAVNLSKWKTQTTSYSALSSDFNATIAMSASSPLTVTIPNNNFSQGFRFSVIRLGTGAVTFSPVAGAPGTASGTGVILNQSYSRNQLASRWSEATLIYSGTPSVGWTLFGDLV